MKLLEEVTYSFSEETKLLLPKHSEGYRTIKILVNKLWI
jgi:hypothetical protein